MNRSQSVRTSVVLASIAALALAVAGQLSAQDKGTLAYNGDKDAAYLILDGRNDNRAARLSVDGDENLRGFLELHRDGSVRVSLYVDDEGEGGLTLRNDSNDAVSLFVDDDNESGVLNLRAANGESRVRLYVDDQGQGQLRLEGAANADRVSVYVDGADQGGLTLLDSNGDNVANLYVDDDSDTGVLVLKEAGGNTRAYLRVTDSGRGKLVLEGSSDTEKSVLYVDGAEQGGLTLRGSSDEIAANLYVDDSSDTGVLVLKEASGDTRAYLRVSDSGRGQLSLDGQDSSSRAELYVDGVDQGGLNLRGTAAGTRAQAWVDNGSDSGMLRLYDGAGNMTVELDGEAGVISKSGVNGFLIAHPADAGREIFYASLEGPEAGMYVRGSAKLLDGVARVELPTHFAAVARRGTVTVQVTPTTVDTPGLAVTEKGVKGFEVRELGGGGGYPTFDYVVMAERGDIEPIEVVRARPDRRVEPVSGLEAKPKINAPSNLLRPKQDDFASPVLKEDRQMAPPAARRQKLRSGDQLKSKVFTADSPPTIERRSIPPNTKDDG